MEQLPDGQMIITEDEIPGFYLQCVDITHHLAWSDGETLKTSGMIKPYCELSAMKSGLNKSC